MSPFAQAQADAFATHAANLPGAHLDWVAKARADAFARFSALDVPDARDEAWKYTALRSYAQRSPSAGDADAATRDVDAATWALPVATAARLVFVNGTFRDDLSDFSGVDRDALSVMPLSRALRQGADGLCHFLTASFATRGTALAELNASFLADGCVVRVADGARIAAPVQMVFVGAPLDREAVAHVRNVVKVGAGASMALVEQHAGTGAWLNAVTQVQLAADARLDHVRAQAAAVTATAFARTDATLAARAHYAITALDFGAQLARHDLAIALAGEGAATAVHGAALVAGRSHADLQLRVHHRARDTSSRIAFRGIADGRARSVLGGAIVVHEGADGADAALSNKNLLLSPHAEIDAKPELEIHADDVKAAHGATVGQLDERALFYLRSRGIDAPQARALLTFAFVREMLDGVADPALREHLASHVAQRLPNVGAPTA